MMAKQFIVSIGREFGSGGHVIASNLAKRFGVKIYDKNLLDEVAEALDVDMKEWSDVDEHKKIPFFSRTVKEYSNSPQDLLRGIQFDFLKKKASDGESFVIVGRCSDYILRDYDGLVRIFVTGDKENKIKRLEEKRKLTRDEAVIAMNRVDRERRKYHDSVCDTKWGDARAYDLIINSRIGINESVDIIVEYIKKAIGLTDEEVKQMEMQKYIDHDIAGDEFENATENDI